MPAGGRFVAMLAAAGAVAVAGAVASVVVATSTGGGGNRELEKTTKEFLAATAAGAAADGYYGVCDGTPDTGAPRRLVETEGPGFTFDLTSSTATGDTAYVNLTVVGRDRSPTPYAVDLRREGGIWRVCRVETGSIQIDVGGPGAW
ncbi:hypothetical protein [Yinghuangia aomiensis]